MPPEDMIWIPDGGFWIDRHPVTNAEYLQFVATAPRSDKKLYEADHRFADPAVADHPAGQVTWYGAVAYAAWRNARLPTLVEWQAATSLAGMGKVWEWTSTDWDTSSDQGWVFRWIDGKKIFEIPIKVLCGGSWLETADGGHPGKTTHQFTPIRGCSGVGFRCAR
ncbi:MAG: SUMF1/EgtB/PvdO family nonheme iron enzyme [Acidobacteria bacterium]|nr:SUMF1/EgtB/PvdO family nonheme iron enzyme [Acidobacteriota bacterium]